ncbi:hypothetical protein C5748_23120 [Phyllobacterium phragmitis]|uniref:Uncharacterized protein n=1 Tax=Phyllobacterium phragmitis TaxID=2670329 RepID=A0A2S9IKS9_9HYPH|nr:hypothetical protein C5748_23120 [Phyllobacterium phragmitis]
MMRSRVGIMASSIFHVLRKALQQLDTSLRQCGKSAPFDPQVQKLNDRAADMPPPVASAII